MKPLTERQRFERWAGARGMLLGYNADAGYYVWRATQMAWEAWQAAVRSVRARGVA